MRKRTIADIDRGLRRSSLRGANYRAKGDRRSDWLERRVQDRLLDERNALESEAL